MYLFTGDIPVASKQEKLVPSFLKLRTTLAEGAAVWSWLNRLYSSSMYSGGSSRAAGGPCWGLRSVRFMVDRKWLRKSRASSRESSAAGVWGLRGLHVLKHTSVGSRTSSRRMEQTDTLMAERRSVEKGARSKRREDTVETPRVSVGGLSCGAGQVAAVGGFCSCWSGGLLMRAGLCYSVWRCHSGPVWPSSLCPPGETEQSSPPASQHP